MIFKTRNLFLAQLLGLSLLLGAFSLCAAVPQVLNHQGRVSVGGKNFDGSGQFKFALVDGEGTTSFWSNDGTSNEGGEPTNPVTLAVTKGLYSVLLGDDTLDNMTVIPVSALDNGGVRLRVWFSDGSNGFQQFSPDQRLAATPYAIQAVEATGFSGSLAGDVTGTQGATAISASTVTGKLLTGYVSSAGTISSSDSILNAIKKLNGNDALKADLNNPTFTGTVSGITKSMVGLGNVDNTADSDKPVSTAQQSALDLKAPLASPTFTGTVNGITKSMVELGNVDNTADADKAISDLTQIALDAKQEAGSYATLVDGVVPAIQLPSYVDDVVEFAELVNFPVTGEVGKIYVATATGKIYRWSGTIYIGIDPSPGSSDAVTEGVENLYYTAERAAADAPVQSVAGRSGIVALSKTDVGLGNIDNTADVDKPVSTAQQSALDLKAPLASPTFSGTVSGITKSMVGLGNVDNTADADKAISTAQQIALNLKAPLASPTFTGTVSGITKSMVGLGNVSNTGDADKPVSNPQQTALALKAPLESPTFTGTVLFPAGNPSSAPLQLAAGSNLTTPVFGSVEFDGDQLYLTGNAENPIRRALAFADGQVSSVELTNITAAPLKPVVAWGEGDQGQTTVPILTSAQSIAAGGSHSLALLDEGVVLAWGANESGQATVPAGLISVTEVAAGSNHNLALKVDGTVVAWGDDSYGQATVPAGISTATQVAAGEKHSLVLLSDGTVQAWGNNNFDQLEVPLSLSNVTVTAIAAGYDHSLALTESGTVIAWGRSDAGQLDVPEGLNGVSAIAAGAYHGLALKNDGTVVAWGWDNAGQSSVPVGLGGVTRISAGYGFSMALKSDRTVVVWGSNFNQETEIPVDATQVTSIAAGSTHALALRADSIPAQIARLDQDNVFTGRVGIGRTPTTNTLEIAGNASKSIAGSWLSNSDRRIKTDVKSIAGGLETLDKVRLVDFRYTDDYLAAHPEIDDKRYPNVIAQEFAEVFPDHVKESGEFLADGSSILQVDTYPLTIYSAVAVQELHRDSLELRKQNELLRQQLSDQEDRLDKLEALLESR